MSDDPLERAQEHLESLQVNADEVKQDLEEARDQPTAPRAPGSSPPFDNGYDDAVADAPPPLQYDESSGPGPAKGGTTSD